MKIVIAGGSNTADYIIKNFKGRSHQLTIINFDREAATYLAKSAKLPVFYGDPTKPYCLKDAKIEGYDIFIALGNRDCDNYVSCLLAKKIFDVKKCICICSNPKNAEPVALVLNPIKEKELSKSMLEVAAIIAYKQPVTRIDLEEIRGDLGADGFDISKSYDFKINVSKVSGFSATMFTESSSCFCGY